MLYVCNKKLFVYRNCGLGVLFKIFSYETSIIGFKENFRKAKLVFNPLLIIPKNTMTEFIMLNKLCFFLLSAILNRYIFKISFHVITKGLILV